MPELRHSVCALDCPDTCAMLVQIGTDGRATRLSGDPAHPVTRGFLCAKVTKYLERVYHPERLLYPLRRIGEKGEGRFERVTWDEALDDIAGRLKAIAAHSGSEAILPYSYGGTMGVLNGSGMDRRFFHRLGASRLDRTICASTGGAALTLSQGFKVGMEPEQFVHAKLILAWGANILGTNPHLWPFIVEARRRGAKFYVIDPYRNRTGKAADRHFAINPGSDLALALGLAHVLIRDGMVDSDYVERYSTGYQELVQLARRYTPAEVARRTGIDEADIEALAHEYGTAKPGAIRVNYGVQRNERGGAAVRAIASLPVLTGNWRTAGGGLQLTTSGAFEFDTAGLERADLQITALGREARLVNMSRFGHALTELDNPRVEGLVVYNSNPAAVAPNQSLVLEGLRRSDLFTVVLEQFQTDTADFADYVLPVTTFLEHGDLYRAYGHYYLQMARPALPAAGETRSNVEIFRALAQRMGFEDACFAESEHDMIASALGSGSQFLKGITLERLERERWIQLGVSPDGAPFLPFAKGDFRTASRRFEFGADALEYVPPVESRYGSAANRFPLELVTPKNDHGMNSSLGYGDAVDSQTGLLFVHRDDARARGIVNGAPVRVFNERGSCTLIASLSDDVKPGVVVSRSTRWNKRSPKCSGVNRLTSDRLTDIGGGATFYSCLVEITPDPGEFTSV